MSTADLEFRLLNNQSHFPRNTMTGSFNFLQEKSVCLASISGSQVNYFMLFSHHANHKYSVLRKLSELYVYGIGTKEQQNIIERENIKISCLHSPTNLEASNEEQVPLSSRVKTTCIERLCPIIDSWSWSISVFLR